MLNSVTIVKIVQKIVYLVKVKIEKGFQKTANAKIISKNKNYKKMRKNKMRKMKLNMIVYLNLIIVLLLFFIVKFIEYLFLL